MLCSYFLTNIWFPMFEVWLLLNLSRSHPLCLQAWPTLSPSPTWVASTCPSTPSAAPPPPPPPCRSLSSSRCAWTSCWPSSTCRPASTSGTSLPPTACCLCATLPAASSWRTSCSSPTRRCSPSSPWSRSLPSCRTTRCCCPQRSPPSRSEVKLCLCN